MDFIDTHTHLYLSEFDESDNEIAGSAAVKRAVENGVRRMVFPNVDLSTVAPMKELAHKFPHNISMAMGLHPTEVGEDWRDVLGQIDGILSDGTDYVAVGEVGIDLYWDKKYCDEQMQVFEFQALRSVELGLPLIIHCRDGLAQALEVIQGVKGARGVFHSFGGNGKDVEAIRRVGDFYFGINGIVTFKNSDLRNHLAAIGLERLLLETDSPYLAPVPHRGKRNESAFLPFIGAHIAQTLEKNIEEIASTTTENAITLFGLK